MKGTTLCGSCRSLSVFPFSSYIPPFLSNISCRHRTHLAPIRLQIHGWKYDSWAEGEWKVVYTNNEGGWSSRKLRNRLKYGLSQLELGHSRFVAFRVLLSNILEFLLFPARAFQRIGYGAFRGLCNSNRVLREAIAGAAAEATAEIVLYPLDTLKVRIQSYSRQPLEFAQWHVFSSATGRHLGSRGFSRLISRNYIGDLYKGIGQSVIAVLPTAAIFAIVYHNLKRSLLGIFPTRCHQTLRPITSLVAGAIGTTLASLMEAPTELVKSRLQTENGVRGLYQGARSNLLRNLPFDALEFASFETLKDLYLRMKKKKRLENEEMWMLGAFAGGLVGALTTPFDVVYTRLVTQPSTYFSVSQTLKLIYQQEGVKGLFRGILPKVAWEAANSGVFFLVFDGLMQSFDTVKSQPVENSG
ncbi:Probable S-adenosylmethionine carrier 2, chloroplastic [Galdieria sulphuraria]|nr:Probable S-adenosylmethionine carrier 2, chloroplastic [Galdieria sulphuraria]